MSSNLLVNLEFKCRHFQTQGRLKLKIDSWENKCIYDVKKLIQEELSVPICDQTLFCNNGRSLTDDSLALTRLYLREGDTIRVEYMAAAEIKEMQRLMDDLRTFTEHLSLRKEDELFEISSEKDTSTYPRYELAASSIEKLAFDYFIPWKNPISVAQRHYFVQEGSFDDFLEIFKFSERRYRGQITSETDEEDKKPIDIVNVCDSVAYYNNEQMVLQMDCLSLLWNFSERREDRMLVLHHGGLQMVCDALLLDPNVSEQDDDSFWVIISINETAVGCLVQYAEFAQIQEILANCKKTINKLIYMVACRRHRETSFYSLYSSQIAANTLFCSACNIKSPVVLVENGVHVELIELTKNLLNNDHNIALRYYCCLFLARILCCPLLTLETEIITQIDNLLDLFITEHTPKEVSKWEEENNYVWVSMVPFVSLAFAGGLCTTSDDESEIDTGNDKSHTWPGTMQTQRMGLFAIKHMMRLKENCLLLKTEKLLPYLQCLAWYLEGTDSESLKDAMPILSPANPPSLTIIAKSQLARMQGFEVVLNL